MTPATDWREVVPPDEAARLERYAEQLRELQRKHATSGRADRALHAKGHGVEAELTVLGDLPEYARVGLFATPTTYRAYARFSNGSGRRQSDTKPDVRGLAVKIVGVPGKKLIPGMEGETTQDLLLITTPATPFRDADEFVSFVLAAENQALLIPRVLGRFGIGRGVALIKKLLAGLSAPITSVATTPYFSALPIQYGAYAAKYALAPRAPADSAARKGASPEYLADELAARLRQGPVSYDLQVQFFRDEATTPIEDGSVAWTSANAPFLTVGRLTLPRQDPASPRGRRVAELVERFSFDPWHALEEHRPLGGMMRARNHAYRLSTQERAAAREPDGSEALE